MTNEITTKNYTEQRKNGRPAEAMINGTTRGGFVLNGMFYAHRNSWVQSTPVSSVTNLKFHVEA